MGKTAALAPARRKRKASSFSPPVAGKRRRTPAQASGWASLPTDMVLLVARRVLESGDLVDAWVALCDGDAVRPDGAGEITFFHVLTGRCLRVPLPEIRGYRIVGFTDGLVILLHKRTTAVRVLHTFTRAAVDFPRLGPVFHQAVRNQNALLHMSAAVCTASSRTSSIAVVVWFACTPGVLSAEPGRPTWKVIHKDMQLSNALPFRGELYGVTRQPRQIVQVYPPNPRAPVCPVPAYHGNPMHCQHCLVDSGRTMLLVVQHGEVKREGREPWDRFGFEIFQPHLFDGRWRLCQRPASFSNHALFIGKDRCMLVSSRALPWICKNSVYFSATPPNDIILHSLSNQSSQRPTTSCQVHDTKERIRPSVRPFTIADHLLTYCNLREWTNGLMFHEFRCIPKCFEDLHNKIRMQDSQLRIPRI